VCDRARQDAGGLKAHFLMTNDVDMHENVE
jgi:hypothetical protein